MRIFKKKEKTQETFLETKSKQTEIKKQLDLIFRDKNNKVCKLCENSISEKHKWTKQGGYFWHKDCWNKAKKLAMKQVM